MGRAFAAAVALAWLLAGSAAAAPTSEPERLVGVYKGVVLNNVDPLQEGRIQVSVPAVPGLAAGHWAQPSAPSVAAPPVGAQVSVEFQGGDRNYPIWIAVPSPLRRGELGPWAPVTP